MYYIIPFSIVLSIGLLYLGMILFGLTLGAILLAFKYIGIIIFSVLVHLNYLAIVFYIISELVMFFKSSNQLRFFSNICISIYFINLLLVYFFYGEDFLGALFYPYEQINLDSELKELLGIPRTQ